MSQPCVLCISSDPSMIERLRASLRALGVSLHAASCAKDAVAVIRTEHVRLVLIDPLPNTSLSAEDLEAHEPDPTALVPMLRAERQDVPVVVASGPSIADAVAALLKPASAPATYEELLLRSRSSIAAGHWAEARDLASHALGLNPSRADALNLLGAILDLQTHREQATNYYRAAIAIDPSYRPAQRNLFRHGGGLSSSAIELGESVSAGAQVR